MFCRLCLYDEDERNLILIENNTDIARKIYLCVDINVLDDDLSKFVCKTCIDSVLQWVSFKEKCICNQKILESRIEQEVNLTVEKRTRTESLSSDSNCSLNEFLDLDKENINHNSNFSYTCDICSKNFDSCFDFIDHQPIHDGQLVFQCDMCSDVFSSRKALVEHDKNHKLQCTICGKYLLKSSMKLHKILHTDRYRCPECDTKCNSQSALDQHTIIVHTNIKDHICDVCGKRFSSNTALWIHMKSHTEDRQYQCKICSYAGRTASALYMHMTKHSTDICICQICSKKFKSWRNLNDHLRRAHKAEKIHLCPHCGKKYASKYILKVHLRSHTGVRPYECNICNKSFTRSDGLRDHMLIHDRDRKFTCEKCGRVFITKKSVSRHKC